MCQPGTPNLEQPRNSKTEKFDRKGAACPAPDQSAYYHEPYDYGYDGYDSYDGYDGYDDYDYGGYGGYNGYDQYGYAEDAYGAPDAYGELGGLAEVVCVCVFENG